MKHTLKLGITLLALHFSGLALAGGEGWSSDFAASQKEAAETKKDLLIDFTGSDWCGWCIKLKEEVFSHDEFKAGVKDQFVLVELDYPRDKSKLSGETIKQNEELGEKYQVRGYPTILLTDAEGRPFAITGYQPGGPEAYVKHLEELRAQKSARDEAFEKAEKTEGVEKAKALVAALGAMGLNDAMVSNFYGGVVEQIKVADPQDETGFMKAEAAKLRIAKFQADLNAFGQKQDFDGALAHVDKTLAEGGFEAEETQQMMMTRAAILAQQRKFDEAIKAVDEAKAIAPESKLIEGIDGFKKRLESEKEKAGTAEPAAAE
ncbi:MAG: thioredoxin family protein [Akkermansiaceae bacterium]